MQIDRLNHLHFPPDSNPAPTGKEPASAAGAHAKPAAAVRPNVPTLVDRTAHQPPIVVLKIQNNAAEGVDDAAADAPVYSDGRKVGAGASDAAHEAQMAQEHLQALERNAGVLTRMSVDKDGVLVVAKPQAPVDAAASAAPTDFVTMAVNTMREFADEAARQKADSTGSVGNANVSAGTLKGLQHLAARFKLFA